MASVAPTMSKEGEIRDGKRRTNVYLSIGSRAAENLLSRERG